MTKLLVTLGILFYNIKRFMSFKRIISRIDVKGDNLVKGMNLEGLKILGKPWDFSKYYYEKKVEWFEVEKISKTDDKSQTNIQ